MVVDSHCSHPHSFLGVVLIGAGAALEAVNRDGNTPLLFAASCVRPLLLQELLNQGANAMVVNRIGKSAVYQAVVGDQDNESTKVEWCDQFVVVCTIIYVLIFLCCLVSRCWYARAWMSTKSTIVDDRH